MLIRTQDRMELINLDNIVRFMILRNYDRTTKQFVGNKHKIRGITTGTEECDVELGEYSTEEKAIEVLDRISTHYHYLKTESAIPSVDARTANTFQIPQDWKDDEKLEDIKDA